MRLNEIILSRQATLHLCCDAYPLSTKPATGLIWVLPTFELTVAGEKLQTENQYHDTSSSLNGEYVSPRYADFNPPLCRYVCTT